MPTGAATAGLLVGSLIGAALLCSGFYFFLLYIKIRCEQANIRFRPDALVEHADFDVENGIRTSRTKGTDVGPGTRQYTSRVPSMVKSSRRKGECEARSCNMHSRGGGNDHKGDGHRVNKTQTHPHMTKATPVVTQPALRTRALGCFQRQPSSEDVCCPPACHHQASPRPELLAAYPQAAPAKPSRAAAGRVSRLASDLEVLEAQLEAHQSDVRFARRPPGQPSRSQESISFEGDFIEVVDRYPSVIDKARQKRRI